MLENVITGLLLAVRRRGNRAGRPAPAAGLGLVCRQEGLPGLPARRSGRRVCHDPRLFPPTWGAVVAFDARSTDQQRTARRSCDPRRDELRRFGQQLDRQAPARARIRIELGGEPVRTVGRAEAKAAIARVDGEITCETMLLDLDRRSIDLGTAAHEMIHQLARRKRSGAASRRVPGLAARGSGGAVRGDPRRPLVGNQPCPRPAAARLAANPGPDSPRAPGPQTPASAAATSATCTPRPGPWSITSAPGTPRIPDVPRLAARPETTAAPDSPALARRRPRFPTPSSEPSAPIWSRWSATGERSCDSENPARATRPPTEPKSPPKPSRSCRPRARTDGIDRTSRIAKID